MQIAHCEVGSTAKTGSSVGKSCCKFWYLICPAPPCMDKRSLGRGGISGFCKLVEDAEKGINLHCMKQDILNYLIGLCQAASAALLVSGVIMPDVRVQSLIGCVFSAIIGIVLVILKNRGNQ